MTGTKLPKQELFVLCCVLISEAFTITMILPFAVFMVQDFKVIHSDKYKNDRSLGYFVGLLAFSFGVCHFAARNSLIVSLHSIIWNWVADNYGRKVVLVLGQLGSTIMIILFGLSQNYGWAIATRAVMGLVNGNSGIAKIYLNEITDNTNRQRAFSFIGAIWSLGVIIGPAVGGIDLSWLMHHIFTMHSGFLARPAQKYPDAFAADHFLVKNPYIIPCLASAVISFLGFVLGLIWLKETLKKDPTQAEESEPLQPPGQRDGLDDPRPTSLRYMLFSVWLAGFLLINFSDYWSLARQKRVSVIMWLLALSALIQVFAIWSVGTVKDGWGLEFRSFDIGIVMTVAGVTLVGVQIWGPLASFRIGMIINVLSTVCFPLLTLLQPEGPYALWPVLLFVTIIRAAGLTASVSRELVAPVNRLGQAVSSLARAFGPPIGGALLAWSLLHHDTNPFPVNEYFVFLLVSLLSLVSFMLSFRIRYWSLKMAHNSYIKPNPCQNRLSSTTENPPVTKQ